MNFRDPIKRSVIFASIVSQFPRVPNVVLILLFMVVFVSFERGIDVLNRDFSAPKNYGTYFE
jgi:hypothetical protein